MNPDFEISSYLKAIVDHPLQAGQSANHNDPNGKTVPKTWEANVLVDSAHRSSKGFSRLAAGVEFAYHDIGRVGDDGAENTSGVTTSKRDTSLCTFAIV